MGSTKSFPVQTSRKLCFLSLNWQIPDTRLIDITGFDYFLPFIRLETLHVLIGPKLGGLQDLTFAVKISSVSLCKQIKGKNRQTNPRFSFPDLEFPIDCLCFDSQRDTSIWQV